MDHHYQYPNSTHVAQTGDVTMPTHYDSNFTITPAIHRAVFVNNEGTKLVRQRQYDAAVKSFTAVLKILKPLAALVETNDSNEVTPSHTCNDDCIPMSISFANNSNTETVDNSSSGNDLRDINMPASFETVASLRQIESASSEENDEQPATQPQSPSASETYWNGGISPRPSDRKKQRRLSTAAATKLLAASAPANKFARRKTSHFVFKDPVEIPPTSVPSNVSVDDKGGHSSELFSKFLMIVMYNLALTLHLHALSLSNHKPILAFATTNDSADAKKAKKLFLRSRKLYELAFEMHLDESCDVNLLFTLALINNLGLVYDVLGQKQRSKTCFKNMFSTMMYLMDSNESHTVKEWDGLLSNVMDILFQQHREIAAPAA